MKEHEVDWTPLEDIKPVRVGRGYSTFSAEEGERIRRFWMEKQVCAVWIARYFGIGINGIKIIDNILHRRIKYTRPAVRLLSSRKLKTVWLRHMDGEEITNLAKEFDTSSGALRSRFARRGWKVRPRRLLRDKVQTQVEKMTRAGMSQLDIAAQLSVSEGTVQHCRRVMRERIMEAELAR